MVVSTELSLFLQPREIADEVKGRYFSQGSDPNLIPIHEYCLYHSLPTQADHHVPRVKASTALIDEVYYAQLKEEVAQGLRRRIKSENPYKRYIWRAELVPQSRKECTHTLKEELRKGVPDHCRSVV